MFFSKDSKSEFFFERVRVRKDWLVQVNLFNK